ncbi:MAG: hypothetical protein ABIQ89_02140 [Candidatus Saccharimonadales bacterium]
MPEIAGSDELHFVKGSAHRIATRSWNEIESLRERYYRQTLQRSPKEIERFLDATTPETWANPNLSTQTRSRYARIRAIAAYRGDELSAFVLAANNVSRQRDGLVGKLEEVAKLKSPINLPKLPLLESRFVTIREVMGHEDSVVMAGMTAHLINDYRDRQPVTGFIYEDEAGLKAALESWGMHEDGVPEEVHPYGGLGEPEHQTRMLADTVAGMTATMRTQEGVIQVMFDIASQVSIDSGSGVVPFMHPLV